MIQPLGSSSLSFKANDAVSVRDAYNDKVASNSKIAQKQNDIITSTNISPVNTQIAMQGNNGQNLDVMA